MEPNRILLRRAVAQAFFRYYMQQDGALHLEHIFQCRQQMLEVMTVDRAGVPDSQLLEEQSGQDGALC